MASTAYILQNKKKTTNVSFGTKKDGRGAEQLVKFSKAMNVKRLVNLRLK